MHASHTFSLSVTYEKSVNNTLSLLRQELEIRKGELLENLHFASLEKIFIEERIYKDVRSNNLKIWMRPVHTSTNV